jgi:hypothetical protein
LGDIFEEWSLSVGSDAALNLDPKAEAKLTLFARSSVTTEGVDENDGEDDVTTAAEVDGDDDDDDDEV